jgi:hypothetical protein
VISLRSQEIRIELEKPPQESEEVESVDPPTKNQETLFEFEDLFDFFDISF